MVDQPNDGLHVMAFLGATPYTRTTYQLDGYDAEERFSTAGIVSGLLQRGVSVRKVSVLLTEQAEEHNWLTALRVEPPEDAAGLQPRLAALSEAGGNFEINPVRQLPAGADAAELWRIFGTILEQVGPRDQLAVDVTSGFRALPILFAIALGVLTRLRQVRVAGVYYAPYVQGQELVRVIDLAPMLELIDWAGGVQSLLATGDARPLATLMGESAGALLPDLVQYGEALAATADALSCAAMPEIPRRATQLQEVHEQVVPIVRSLGDRLAPVEEVLELVQSEYAGLAAPSLAANPLERLRSQLQAAEMLFDHQQYMQGFTILRETLTDIGLMALPGVTDRQAYIPGAAVAKRFGAPFAPRYDKLRSTISKWRNRLDHAWSEEEFVESQRVAQAGDAVLRSFRELIDSVAGLLAPPRT